MNKKIVCFYMLLLVAGLNAQQNLDSLYAVWQDPAQTDSTRVNAYRDYIWKGFLYSKPDSALVLIDALHQFAKAQEFVKATSLGYHLQGIAYRRKHDFIRALAYYEKSLAIKEQIGEKQGSAASLNNIGLIYYDQGDYIQALEYYKKSLAIKEQIGNQQGIAASLNNIGRIYDRQRDFTRALEYYEKALAIREEIGDKYQMAISLNNIGIVYSRKDSLSRALEYYEKALTIREEIGYKRGLANSLMSIANVYGIQKNYARSLEYYERSLTIREEIRDKPGIAFSLNNIGLTYSELGNYTRALDYCKNGLVLAKEIGYLQIQMDACQCLYETYKNIGNSLKALQFHEQMLMLNDSLKLEETSKKLQQMEFAKQVLADSLLQVEKDLQVEMAHQTEVRKKDKNRNLAIGAGIFFLVLSGGFYSRWRYVRTSKKIIEKEKDRSENLLLNILPSEIAEELKAKGSVDARDFDQVSVLFTDFKGFTNRSEKLSARELVKEINQCFEAFDHICGNYKIEKIKTIGDAYMAGGGLPVPSDDAVKNTVLAALEMQAFMEKRAIEKKGNKEIPFEMRVGINTGPVVAGIVGVKKFQYDIWGDTVNTASRMESSGEVGKVNISQDTYEIIKDDPQFSFESRGKIKAKGKGEVEMYFVTSVKAA